MRSLLYIVAVILVIGWAIGTFAYSAGGLIYVLLVLAVISFIFGILRRDTVHGHWNVPSPLPLYRL